MKERIKEVLATVLKREVDDATSQDNCPEWDSLHHLNMIVEMEMAFDISFEPEEMGQMKSVADIERLVKQKLGQA
jgi:acyl carrier protein